MATLQQWSAFRANPTEEERERLISEYAPFARYVASRVAIRGATLGEEDLLGQAILGLLEAIDRYDPKVGAKFETFAYYRIRGAVLDLVRKMDVLPQSANEDRAKLEKAYEALISKLGRQPSDEEVAAAMGITMEELGEVLQDVHAQTVLSLELTRSEDDDSTHTIGDMLSDGSSSPEECIIDTEDRQRLAQAIDQLPERDRLVVSLYYHEGLTMKEISLVLNVTEARVCQLHARAITRVRALISAEERMPCL